MHTGDTERTRKEHKEEVKELNRMLNSKDELKKQLKAVDVKSHASSQHA